MNKAERIELAKIQDLVGNAINWHGNDRDPNGFEKGQKALKEAFSIVVEMRSKYPPEDGRIFDANEDGWDSQEEVHCDEDSGV